MREVMLTDFATLSPSDTLADALVRCVHSLQEDFPVVRGQQLVGIVNRQRIVEPCAPTATATSRASCPAPSRSPSQKTP
jgi:predicted transcriptional regulator